MEFHNYIGATCAVARLHGINMSQAAEIRKAAVIQMTREAEKTFVAGRKLQGIEEYDNELVRMHFAAEAEWDYYRRPYYLVYPTVVPLLTRVSLDFPGRLVEFPAGMVCLCIRLAKGHEISGVRAVLACRTNVWKEGVKRDGISIFADRGECASGFQKLPDGKVICPFGPSISLPLTDKPLSEEIDGIPTRSDYMASKAKHFDPKWNASDALMDATRLVVACLMVASGGDGELIRPDVLSGDRIGYRLALESADDQRAAEIEGRAFRRRGPGWSIGEKYEHVPGCPYVVPPHPQRYWVGKGRSKVVVLTRRGYVVKREDIAAVPTGFDAPAE